MSRAAGPPTVVCLLGPTASGKTGLAVELVDQLPLEIVSVDSAMIYRGMDVGTAKPGPDVLRRAPHHLIDIRDPWQSYSAGQFARDARLVIDEIVGRGRTPLLVGGTFLYFRALEHGLAPMPERDAELRAQLDRRAAAEGWPALHAELGRVDPVAAARIDPQDRQRIQRALEVHALSGEPISQLHKKSEQPRDFQFVSIVIEPRDRSALHRRIETRLEGMMRAGFLEEVERLRSMSELTRSSSAMRAVGYRQLWEHLDGQTSLAEAGRRAMVATRRYAKRQLTWLRSVGADFRLDFERPDKAKIMRELLKKRGIGSC